MGTLGEAFHPTAEFGHYDDDLTLSCFFQHVNRSFSWVKSTSWPTEARTIQREEWGGKEFLRLENGRSAFIYGEMKVRSSSGALVPRPIRLWYNPDGRVHVKMGVGSAVEFENALAELRQKYPPVTASDQAGRKKVPLAFWMDTGHGATMTQRKVVVPDWVAIADNYTEKTRKAMRSLATEFKPHNDGGQLILWHGSPGTGKTYAIRALLWEWQNWASFHYITDPESFFSNPSYLLNVISTAANMDEDDEEDVEDGTETGRPRKNPDEDERWRVLIMEDTGELISSDAKHRVGQGLSRLLNLVDGLLGQGLRLLVLITTNEELGKLHPAVSRPGRCLFRHEFGKLTPDEAIRWVSQRGGEPRHIHVPTSIAECYALVEGREKAEEDEPRRMGFK